MISDTEAKLALHGILSEQDGDVNIVRVDRTSQFVRDVTLFVLEVPNEVLEHAIEMRRRTATLSGPHMVVRFDPPDV